MVYSWKLRRTIEETLPRPEHLSLLVSLTVHCVSAIGTNPDNTEVLLNTSNGMGPGVWKESVISVFK